MRHNPADAWLRGGAGPMKDRRAPRGGARNRQHEYLEEYDTMSKHDTTFNEIVPDLICTAIESGHYGIGYWCPKVREGKKPTEEQGLTPVPYYMFDPLHGGSITLFVDEDEDGELTPHTLDQEALWKGWRLMQHHDVKRWACIIDQEHGDAEDADVFIQYCLFGEVVYG